MITTPLRCESSPMRLLPQISAEFGLSPEQIERIEIARVATVDVSAQAIAGTIIQIARFFMEADS